MFVFYPDLFIDSITDINLKILYDLKVDSVLLDIDNTISPHKEQIISKEIQDWISEMKKNSIKLSIVSNNSEGRAKYFGEYFGLPYVYGAKKPLPFGIKKAMKMISAKKNKTVLIGDQIFTDVLGARICGLKSILVEPLSKDEDFGIKIKRYAEAYIKKKIKNIT